MGCCPAAFNTFRGSMMGHKLASSASCRPISGHASVLCLPDAAYCWCCQRGVPLSVPGSELLTNREAGEHAKSTADM